MRQGARESAGFRSNVRELLELCFFFLARVWKRLRRLVCRKVIQIWHLGKISNKSMDDEEPPEMTDSESEDEVPDKLKVTTKKLETKGEKGIVVGKSEETDEWILITPNGVAKSRTIHCLAPSER